MAEQGLVELEVEESIGRLIFHHPKGNSLPGHLLRKLTNKVNDAGSNPDINVLVLQSKGDGAFCGGASFDELIQISDRDQGKAFFMGFASLINAMRKCPKFIIGRVQGKAVGGGVGLAAATDHTLAHSYASIKLSELSIGIGPFVIEPVVTRRIGKAAMETLTIDATTWRSAEWARQQGLYADIFDSQEELDDAVSELAHDLAQSSPEAMEELKTIFWEGTDHWDSLLEKRAEISGRLSLSDYTRAFIENFNKS